MSETEIEILVAWAKAGGPQGDEADLSEPPTLHDSGWALGEPDLIVRVPGFELPADGDDIFWRFVLPSKLTEGRFIVAYYLIAMILHA